jgi:hypothetical protein
LLSVVETPSQEEIRSPFISTLSSVHGDLLHQDKDAPFHSELLSTATPLNDDDGMDADAQEELRYPEDSDPEEVVQFQQEISSQTWKLLKLNL